jgi:hypothetical protein
LPSQGPKVETIINSWSLTFYWADIGVYGLSP